ncbi:hypothetical protein Hte_007268 [Hypoxylon texense]
MANLICAIDPFCEIYVARVAEDSFGITPERVAEAIKWARGHNVDIISMSFAIGDEDGIAQLRNEVFEATKEGIIMTCSTHDEGSRITNAYPANWIGQAVSLIVLTACDSYGTLLREAKSDTFHYRIPGQNVAAGVIPFLNSDDTISGSSVSTALATGLCSLMITCDRLGNPEKKYMGRDEKNSRLELVKTHLDQMRSNDKNHFVMLEKFGGIDTPRIGQTSGSLEPGWDRVPSARAVLTKHFGMAPNASPKH